MIDIFYWVINVFLGLASLPMVIIDLIALPFFLWNF